MARRKTKAVSKRKKRSDVIKLVVKSNELVEARYMFDIWETRFFQYLCSLIHRDDEDDKVYRIWFKDIKRLFNLKTNQSYDLLREAAKSMLGKSVQIGKMSGDFRRDEFRRIIKKVDVLAEGQSGKGIEKQEYVDVSIDDDIKPFLLYVQQQAPPVNTRYTKYDVRNTIRLMPYGTRIYELLKQVQYKGFRTIPIDTLKKMFLIEDEYPRFSNFYQKVIEKSIKDINKYSDITVPLDKIERIKEGRKVVGLRFMILSKSKTEIAKLRGEPIQQSLFDTQETNDFEDAEVIEIIEPEVVETEADVLFQEFEDVVVKSFGVTPSVFLKMLHSGKYEKKTIEQAIAVTRRAKYNKEITKSIPGFFVRALKEGFTDVKQEAKKAKQRKEEKEAKALILKQQLVVLEDKRSQAIRDRIREITVEQPDITEQAIKLIKNNPFQKGFVAKRQVELGRALTVDDFREDTRFRGWVIESIVKIEGERFDDIFQEFNPRMEEIQKEIKKTTRE